MAAELSHSTLEFPKEILAILDRVDGKLYGQPVWTFAKHGNGYSLKLFWKANHGVYLDNAHSTISRRKNRNKLRLDAFVAKKRAEGYCSSKSPASALSPTPSCSTKANSKILSTTTAQLEPLVSGQLNLEPARPGPIVQDESVASGQLCSEPMRHSLTAQCVVPPLCDNVINQSPIASRTRSRAAEQANDTTTSVHPKPLVTTEPACDELDTLPACNDPDSQPAISCKTSAPLVHVLHLPEDLQGDTKHYVDFVKCDDADTANRVRDCMQIQWSNLVKPGQKVKVKLKDELVAAVVENSHFISKLSFDCLYFYATTKVDIKLPGSSSVREFQFRDLIL